jgi:predicted molibdopterin-dependent oxidoreductase YjgC
MMRHILDTGLHDSAFISAQTQEFASLENSLAEVDIMVEAAACGVDGDTLKNAAAAFGQAKTAAIIYGTGVTLGSGGVATVTALADLALLTGNLGGRHWAISPQVRR